MKKRLVAVLLVSMLATTMVMGGCGKNSDDAASATSEASAEDSSASDEDTIISTEELLSATDYDITQYVKLPDNYMNMEITLENSYEVTDEEVQEYAESIISSYPAYTETDKTTVEEGDTVNIDYVGKKDGEAFDGGTAEGYNLTIGSGTFIDGFEDGLIGAEVGSTIDLNLTFPEDYSSEELAGQDVVFTVTINAIVEETEMTYDGLTDEYIAENFESSGISTMEDFISEVKSSLESNNESEKQSEESNLILAKLQEESEVTIPDGLLDERVSDYMARVEEAAEYYDITTDEYLSSYVGMTEDEVPDYIQDNLEQELILEAIVADQGITLSQDEFDYFVTMYVSYYGYDDAESFYESYGGKDYVKLSYAENQALSTVMDNATVNEPSSTDASAESSEEAE